MFTEPTTYSNDKSADLDVTMNYSNSSGVTFPPLAGVAIESTTSMLVDFDSNCKE